MRRLSAWVSGPRSSVIPRLGGLHGTLSRFMPSQAIVSRFSPGQMPPCHPAWEAHGDNRRTRKSYHHRKARSMIRAAILTALMASPAMAQQVCLPEPQIEAGFSQRYGETVVDTIEDEQGVWELWGNPESGTWTVTLTRDGTTCVMRAGEGFVDPATPQGEQM